MVFVQQHVNAIVRAKVNLRYTAWHLSWIIQAHDGEITTYCSSQSSKTKLHEPAAWLHRAARCDIATS